MPARLFSPRRPNRTVDARPRYGASYEVDPVPPGLKGEQIQAHIDQSAWYHSIDFGGGVVSRGGKPLEVIDHEWQLFGLSPLSGQTVLDVGTADGAYAFRAEQAGASRVAALDHYVWSVDSAQYGRLYSEYVQRGETPPAPHESELWDPEHLPGRWRFDTARQLLESRVEAVATDFMACDLEEIGSWDVVLFLGVLYHVEDPLRALRRLAAVTRRQAIIETEAFLIPGRAEPMWRCFPHGELNHDRTCWWVPNLGGLLGMLGAAGFKTCAVLAGEPETDPAVDPIRHYRAIVRAVK